MPKNMPPHHFKNFSTWKVCSCTCCSELEPSWLLNFSCWPGFNWISWWCFTGEGLLIKYLDDFVFEVCHQRLFLYSDPNSLLLLWKLEVIWVDLDVSIPNLSDHHVSKKREFSDSQNMQTGHFHKVLPLRSTVTRVWLSLSLIICCFLDWKLKRNINI